MRTVNLIEELDRLLPDSQIIEDITSILWQKGSKGAEIELERAKVLVPPNTRLEVVTKSLFKEYYDVGFGTCYRAQVAVGGVADQAHGILGAEYCFATLYYSQEQQIITVDFHEDMR